MTSEPNYAAELLKAYRVILRLADLQRREILNGLKGRPITNTRTSA